MGRLLFFLLWVTTALILGGGCSSAVQYVGIDLGTLPGASNSIATGISDSGLIVGYSGAYAVKWEKGGIAALPLLPGTTKNFAEAVNTAGIIAGWGYGTGPTHAILWRDGQAVRLPDPSGAFYSYAFDLNDAGQVVGYSYYGNGINRATRWTNGVPQDLGVLSGKDASVATGINDSDVVVGRSMLSADSGNAKCVVWTDSGIAEPCVFVTPSGGEAINDLGQIVGWANSLPALWQNGTARAIGPVPEGSSPQDINNEGQVVMSRGSNHYHPMVWHDDVMYDLAVPLPYNTSADAAAINSSGQVVGRAYVNGNDQHALLWLPVTDSSIGSARVLPQTLPFAGVGITEARVTATGLEAGVVFVESANRCSGIKLLTSQALSVGQQVSFVGMCSRVDGEYVISDARFDENIVDGAPLTPVGVTSRIIGNDRTQLLKYSGVNTTGLLVRMVGKVTATMSTQGVIYVDDGGGYRDGVGPSGGIRIRVAPGTTVVGLTGRTVAITGISRVGKQTLAKDSTVNGSLYAAGTVVYVPSLWARYPSDLRVLD